MEGKIGTVCDKHKVQLEVAYNQSSCTQSRIWAAQCVYLLRCTILPFFLFFVFSVHGWSPSAFSSVGGDGLSLSAFLLAGPRKDGAVNHAQASPSPERQHQFSVRERNNDFCCHTWAFLWSILRTVYYPLIKFILLGWAKGDKGRIVQKTIWVKRFLKGSLQFITTCMLCSHFYPSLPSAAAFCSPKYLLRSGTLPQDNPMG